MCKKTNVQDIIIDRNKLDLLSSLIDDGTNTEDIMLKLNTSVEEFDVLVRELHRRDKKVYSANKRIFKFNDGVSGTILCRKDYYMDKMCYKDTINTNNEPLHILATTDWHAISKKDYPRLVETVYNYAYVNNIKHIIHLGDMTESVAYYEDDSKFEDKIRLSTCSYEEQIKYLDNFIPKTNSIKLHLLQGNHDIHNSSGICNDLVKMFKDYGYERSDIICTGFETQLFQINNDCIHLLHKSYPDFVREYLSEYEESEETQIILCGHSHQARQLIKPGYFCEYTPPLCGIKHSNPDEEKNFYMGFLDILFYFNSEGKLTNLEIERYELTEDGRIRNLHRPSIQISRKRLN